jgi:hypothetical protein
MRRAEVRALCMNERERAIGMIKVAGLAACHCIYFNVSED